MPTDGASSNPLAGKQWGAAFAHLSHSDGCGMLEKLGIAPDKAYQLLGEATKAVQSADSFHIAFATFCGFVASACYPSVDERIDTIDVQPWSAVKDAEHAEASKAELRKAKKQWIESVEDAVAKDLAVANVQEAAETVRRACMNATQQRFHRYVCGLRLRRGAGECGMSAVGTRKPGQHGCIIPLFNHAGPGGLHDSVMYVQGPLP